MHIFLASLEVSAGGARGSSGEHRAENPWMMFPAELAGCINPSVPQFPFGFCVWAENASGEQRRCREAGGDGP